MRWSRRRSKCSVATRLLRFSSSTTASVRSASYICTISCGLAPSSRAPFPFFQRLSVIATPSTLVSAVIPRSTRLDRARESFLDEVGDWIHACIRRYDAAPSTGGHDQATYVTSWEPWLH